MNQWPRRFIAFTGIFVLGVALYVMMVLLGIAFDLSSDLARLLAFVGWPLISSPS